MAEPQANDASKSALLEQLVQLTGEERYELLAALGGNGPVQFNFGESKNFQVIVEAGGTAYNAGTININNSLQVDAGLLRQALEELMTQQAPVSVPYFYPSELGSTNFVGRDDEMQELRQLLGSSERVAIAAATGMGGIGKTELAWQYARQCEQDGSYPAGIWWLGVRGADLSSQILSHSLRMGLGQPPDELPEEVAKVQWCFDRWAAELEGKRLLILDDVTDYRAIAPLLPKDDCYEVLLTTRNQFEQPVKRLDLGVLLAEDALKLLRQLVGDEGRIETELETAQALCEWLGWLPLGIELVGRYLAEDPDLSLGELFSELNDDRLEADALIYVPEVMGYQRNLMKAFELSWRKLDDSGRQLGYLLSIFALAPIPWRLVKACLPDWKKRTLRKCRNQQLIKRSLLERVDTKTYQLHQVIREAFAAKRGQWDGAEVLEQAWAEVLVAEAKQVPSTPTLSVQGQMAAVIPHLEDLAQRIQDGLNGDDTIWPHTSLGWLYEGQSLWQKAEHWKSQVVEVSEQRFGPEHPDTASSVSNLAGLYCSQGRYSEAEQLYERALAIYESQLGPEHPDTVSSVSNLAGLYCSQGRYSEAESLFERALAIRELQLGLEHPDTALSLNNLAGLYCSQGRYSEAEPLHERALAIRELQLGLEHPDTAQSLNNLAALYRSQGRYSEAEPLYERALAIRESQLGPEHPDTASSVNSLAALYDSQGRYSEAEPLYERALAIRESQLGPEHLDTAGSLNNLAFLYRLQGLYSEAEPLLERALGINESQLGPEHPSTANSVNNLAALYESQGRYSEAEPLYERALAIRESKLGPEHPDTATSVNNLAALYESQGRYSEAEPLYERALAICELQLGPEHPSTAIIVNNLAGLYESQSRYSEAALLYERALAIRESKLGPEHPDTAISLNNLAGLYDSQGRYSEAEHLYERAFAIYIALLGSEHPNTQTILGNWMELISQAVEDDRVHELSDHPITQAILEELEQQENP